MANQIEDDNIVAPPPYREDGPPQIVTADTARQGPLGSRVLVILLASLAALFVIGAIWFLVR